MPLGAVNQLLRLAREVEGGLDKVAGPVQLIYSRKDPTVPAYNAGIVMRGLPPGEHELHWLEDSAHVLPVDRERELVARRVVEFLQRLEKHSPGA